MPSGIITLNNDEFNDDDRVLPDLVLRFTTQSSPSLVEYIYIDVRRRSTTQDRKDRENTTIYPPLIIGDRIEMNRHSFTLQSVYLHTVPPLPPAMCLVCLSERANLVMMPCGHNAMGDLCIKTYFEGSEHRACPLCRVPVDEIICLERTGLDFEKATVGREELEREREEMERLGSLGGIRPSIPDNTPIDNMVEVESAGQEGNGKGGKNGAVHVGHARGVVFGRPVREGDEDRESKKLYRTELGDIVEDQGFADLLHPIRPLDLPIFSTQDNRPGEGLMSTRRSEPTLRKRIEK
jgi:hypothetical protein